MAKGSFELWQLVTIEWEDIYVDRSAYIAKAYIEAYKPCVRRTAGYYLGSKNGRCFVTETDDRKANLMDSDCEGITAIPHSVILSIV